MDKLSKQFQEIINKKTQGTITPKEHVEWLQLKKETKQTKQNSYKDFTFKQDREPQRYKTTTKTTS